MENIKIIRLSQPNFKSRLSFEEVLSKRRSHREFKKDAQLNEKIISQILYSAYGITDKECKFLRASPSAGATYPAIIYLLSGNVEGINPGIYLYLHQEHNIKLIKEGDYRLELSNAALMQGFILDAAASIIITVEYERTTYRYGKRGIMYVHIEVGHIAENIYLQAESLGIGTVGVGAFSDDKVATILSLPSNIKPCYILPLGYTRYKKS